MHALCVFSLQVPLQICLLEELNRPNTSNCINLVLVLIYDLVLNLARIASGKRKDIRGIVKDRWLTFDSTIYLLVSCKALQNHALNMCLQKSELATDAF